MDLVIWLIIAAIMIVAEILTLGLTSIWFAGGAFVAAIVAYCGGNWIAQIVLFAVVALVCLVLSRPLAKKVLMKNTTKTNADSLVGQNCYVIEDIDNVSGKGAVKVNGLEWTARSVSNETIKSGEEVVINEIRGVKLMVSKKQ